jgi:hypothetical protein
MSTMPHEPLFGGIRRPEYSAVRPLATLSESCRRCSGHTFERIPRYGFWQETVMPFFNLYPWRCVGCATIKYRSNRAVRRPAPRD